ncbi:uracil-DNA glycosylase, partial [Caulochytrium protostelioides]
LQDEYDALGPRWFAALRAHLTQPSYRALAARVRSARAGSTPIYPPHTDVFSWARFTPDPAQVRCVILGQDPYHGPGQAHGLAFSVRPGVPTPPSLRNMFRELAESDLSAWKARCAAAQRASSSPSSPVVKPPTGDLSAWAAQGVLLLNASLTVPRGQANGHKTWGWHAFTDAVIDIVARSSPHCVFLLWGRDAQLKSASPDWPRHLVLQSAHPSPLAAHNGFFKNGHYVAANLFLRAHGLPPIDW